MSRPRLATRVAALVLAAALASLGAVGAVAWAAVRSVYADANRFALSESARALANQTPAAALRDPVAAGDWARRTAAGTGFRLTLVDRSGTVLADSRADPAGMANHADRPEVAAALAGEAGWALRRSDTLGVEALYAAAPIVADGTVAAVLRLSFAVPELERRLEPLWLAALAGTAGIVLLWVLAARALAASLVAPMATLASAAQAWARGEFGRRSGPLGTPELDQLATALDGMAAELGERIRESESRGRELLGILDGMGEAVVAVDAGLRVRRLNPAALRLFGLGGGDAGDLTGRSLLATLRSPELEDIAERCAREGRPVEAELSLYRDGPAFFLVYAAPLGAPGAAPEGAVLVLNDITRLRRLEQVRTDFVANVSHELRTPVTLIKGFVEALGEGALEDPEEARRFLGIVARHAGRLEAIIADLLSLARLEQAGGELPGRRRVAVGPILAHAAEAAEAARGLAPGARATVVYPFGLEAELDEGLVEQAVLNLVDNALKYAPEGSPVSIGAREEAGRLVVEVLDRGPGIPSKDSERIFERFYRVDRARSREAGGTGLGLSIVRHIALAHGGAASCKPREGGGSVFRLEFPLAPPAGPAEAPAGAGASRRG